LISINGPSARLPVVFTQSSADVERPYAGALVDFRRDKSSACRLRIVDRRLEFGAGGQLIGEGTDEEIARAVGRDRRGP
jgi:hypothetical protein